LAVGRKVSRLLHVLKQRVKVVRRELQVLNPVAFAADQVRMRGHVRVKAHLARERLLGDKGSLRHRPHGVVQRMPDWRSI
jgi:hypothetical protein